MAQRFDANRLSLIGQPFPVATPIHTQPVAPTVGVFSASDGGVVVYQSETGAGVSQLMWFDRAGRAMGQIGEPAAFTGMSISPDGRRLAVGILDGPGAEQDIWLYDPLSGRRTRLTSGDESEGAFTWSPDGLRIAFSSPRTVPPGLILRSTDGSARDQTLPLEAADARTQSGWQPMDWSLDGRLILAAAAGQLWIVPVDGTGKPSRWGTGMDGTQAHGRFDPSGRWIAYQSTRRGTTDIYVSSFPTAGPTWQISTQGGSMPRWRPDGREILYIAPDGGLMAASVSVASGRFEVGEVRPLFRLQRTLRSNRFGSPYVVGRDGNLFIVNTSFQTSTPPSITVVLNRMAHP
jgi:Tol biopolymer transport system component